MVDCARRTVKFSVPWSRSTGSLVIQVKMAQPSLGCQVKGSRSGEERASRPASPPAARVHSAVHRHRRQPQEWTHALAEDRRFLSNVVTSTFVFEGDGRIEEYLGSSEDWQRERARTVAEVVPALPPAAEPRKDGPVSGTKSCRTASASSSRVCLRIESLEGEQARLDATIAGAEFYKESPSAITSALERVEAVRAELDVLCRRWNELDSKDDAPSETNARRVPQSPRGR